MAEAKTIMKGELTITPDAFNTLVKLKEELEDVIETIEIMNDKEVMKVILHKFEHRKEVYK